jgi:hypothetical protein
MLLLDGVEYELWTPPLEDQLEKIVVEHAQNIFGEDSIYFDKKQKLSSLGGVGSIPDGLAIVFGISPEWHIVEVELSTHDPYQHVVPQVDKFINGVENLQTRNKIVDALYESINNDEFLKVKTRQAIGQGKDIHKFLSDLIAKPPTITILIEKDTDQLKEALKKYPQKKVRELQTFRRVGADTVHVHLFEPLHRAVAAKLTTVSKQSDINADKDGLVIEIRKEGPIKYRYFDIPADNRSLFPIDKVRFTLETDVGEIETNVAGTTSQYGPYFQRNLGKWFNAHANLKVGDKFRISVLEPMKKYRLEVVN